MSRRRWLTSIGGSLTAVLLAAAAALVAATFAPGVASGAGTGTGYLHTNGSRIVDSTGATVRLTGLNWFGMETDNHTFHGLWANPPATWRGQIDRMASLGFNTLRVPYAGDALRPGAEATSINTYTNPDLVGLSPLQILDLVIDYAGSKGMRVILDRHRPTAAGQTALWHTSTVSEQSIIDDWRMLAQRYAGNTTVIGADLFNEPHAEGTDPDGTGACWGCGVPDRDWRLGAERIGNAILAVQPNWLIFVEGVSCPSGGTPNAWDGIPDDPLECDWWGGNLSRAGQYPVRLNVANRLVYSPHDYGISVYDRQPWFNDPNFPNNLPGVWDHFWGYLGKNNTAPIMLGEFGSTLASPLDVQWMNTLVQYLTANGMSFTYWSWNPNSGDTGGIALDDWYSINQQKYDILAPHLVPPVGGGPSPSSSPSSSPSPGPSSSPSPSPSPSSPPPSSPPPSSPPPSSPPPTSPPPSSPPPTSPPPGTCSASYTITNSWPGNFQADVTVRNNGTTTKTGWTLTWTYAGNQSIYNQWGAQITQSGQSVTARPVDYTTTIPAGQSITFGIQGTVTGTNAVPSAITCT